VRASGQVLLDGHNLLAPDVDVVALRRRVGMVFQLPNPFPKSIFDNVAYGLRINGLASNAGERAARVVVGAARASTHTLPGAGRPLFGRNLSGNQSPGA